MFLLTFVLAEDYYISITTADSTTKAPIVNVSVTGKLRGQQLFSLTSDALGVSVFTFTDEHVLKPTDVISLSFIEASYQTLLVNYTVPNQVVKLNITYEMEKFLIVNLKLTDSATKQAVPNVDVGFTSKTGVSIGSFKSNTEGLIILSSKTLNIRLNDGIVAKQSNSQFYYDAVVEFTIASNGQVVEMPLTSCPTVYVTLTETTYLKKVGVVGAHFTVEGFRFIAMSDKNGLLAFHINKKVAAGANATLDIDSPKFKPVTKYYPYSDTLNEQVQLTPHLTMKLVYYANGARVPGIKTYVRGPNNGADVFFGNTDENGEILAYAELTNAPVTEDMNYIVKTQGTYEFDTTLTLKKGTTKFEQDIRMTDVFLQIETIWVNYSKAANEIVKVLIDGALKGTFKSNDVGIIEIGPTDILLKVNDIISIVIDDNGIHKAAKQDFKMYSLHSKAQIMLEQISKDLLVFFAIVTNNCSVAEVTLKKAGQLLKTNKSEKCSWSFTDATGLLEIGAKYDYTITSNGYKPVDGIVFQRVQIEQINITMEPAGPPCNVTILVSDRVFFGPVTDFKAQITVDGEIFTNQSNSTGYLNFKLLKLPKNISVTLKVTDERFKLLQDVFWFTGGVIDNFINPEPVLAIKAQFYNASSDAAKGVDVSLKLKGTTIYTGTTNVNGTSIVYLEPKNVVLNSKDSYWLAANEQGLLGTPVGEFIETTDANSVSRQWKLDGKSSIVLTFIDTSAKPVGNQMIQIQNGNQFFTLTTNQSGRLIISSDTVPGVKTGDKLNISVSNSAIYQDFRTVLTYPASSITQTIQLPLKQMANNAGMIIGISIGAVVVVGILGVVGFIIYKKYCKKEKSLKAPLLTEE